jgi:hypothetical protein
MTIEDVTLNGLPLSVTNGIFYMYAVTLTVGNTMEGRKVKENTICGYLAAAAMYGPWRPSDQLPGPPGPTLGRC